MWERAWWCKERDLHMSSYFRFFSLILACNKCGNDHGLFVFGLVKSQPLSLFLIFPNYLALLSMYLMLIFCRRISTDRGEERPECNTYAKPWTGDSPQQAICFVFSIEDNTGALPEGVKQALEALDKFSVHS
jgi:hypothetical protein